VLRAHRPAGGIRTRQAAPTVGRCRRELTRSQQRDGVAGASSQWVSSVKHAGSDALDRLEPLLSKIRCFSELKEARRGIFYRQRRSFLHFHEDSAGLFADLFDGAVDIRLRVVTRVEKNALLKKVADILAR
jgi:hypothetical protein